MKLTKKITFVIIGISLLITPSCTNNQKQENNKIAAKESLQRDNITTYLYAQDRDTILLNLINFGDTISGKLDIKRFEKDSRVGVLYDVQHKGDTLFAIYDSMQEGEKSRDEIALIKKGDSYILSHDIFGKENYQYNSDFTRGSFKNKKVIKFDGETLKKVN